MIGYVGEVRLIAADLEPRNWLFCHGQTLNISDYNSLFSLIGTLYGGDGRTTFKLPDTQSRVVLGAGTTSGLSTFPLGISGGLEKVELTVSKIPAHTHKVQNGLSGNLNPKVLNDEANSDEPSDNYMALADSTQVYAPSANGNMGGTTITYYADLDVANAGAGTGHNNIQPVTTLHYMICTTGFMPSR